MLNIQRYILFVCLSMMSYFSSGYATPKYYTKHYYAGTERLATVIGTGGFGDISPPCRVMTQSEYATIVDPFFMRYSHHTTNPFNYEYKLEKEMVIEDINGGQPSNLQYACHAKDLEQVEVISQGDLLLPSITQNFSIQNQETKRYFYHGDHLGSASWITEHHGVPVQYIHYAPYGELLANQRPCNYDERYKFTGKERDAESGYDFFGARYLWSATGHWMSVDPMADKYPNISPYAYCGWNPVKYVDPDGKEKHNKMDPLATDLRQKSLYEAGNRMPDKENHIFFISHGSSKEMYPVGEEKMTAEGFVSYLSHNSDLWNTTEDKSSLIIGLISCETAQGENSIAQQISKLLPESIIIAPTEEVKAASSSSGSSIVGVAKSEAGKLSDMKNPEYSGQWKAFRNGEQIGTSETGKISYIYNDNDDF